MPFVQFLGPQRFRPTLAAAVEASGAREPLAVVTAGWQERELEVEELDAHLGARTRNLALYRRYDEVLRADPELAAALRSRQDRLRELQELYRVRLAHEKAALRALLSREGDAGLLGPARNAAFAALRALDQHHLTRISELHSEFDARFRPSERRAVASQREEIRDLVANAGAVLVAGGHVAVLLNRLRLFDFGSLLRGRPIIAWSAGAMALCERVVLFHDTPPQGSGDAEVLDFGVGAAPHVVVLPHARRRLRLDDPLRVTLLARRFEPAVCVPLDDGALLSLEATGWRAGAGTYRLDASGACVPLEAR